MLTGSQAEVLMMYLYLVMLPHCCAQMKQLGGFSIVPTRWWLEAMWWNKQLWSLQWGGAKSSWICQRFQKVPAQGGRATVDRRASVLVLYHLLSVGSVVTYCSAQNTNYSYSEDYCASGEGKLRVGLPGVRCLFTQLDIVMAASSWSPATASTSTFKFV